jgi:glycosyltransferase involved in cell wall biosynthesis
MVKVAFLSFDFGEYSTHLVSALASYADVLFLTPEGNSDAFYAHLDPRVHLQVIPYARFRQPTRQWQRNRYIMQQVRKFGADLLHVQQGSLWFNIGMMMNRELPLIVTVHDAEPHPGDRDSRKTPQWLRKLAFQRADGIIVHTRYVQDILRNKLHLGSKPYSVIPHIQIGQAKHSHKEESDDCPCILFFGRIWAYKGLEYLIRAEPLIAKCVRNFHILIAGVGEDMQRYIRMMEHPERFTIINRYIPNEEADRIFTQSDIVVLPYVESSQSGVIPMAYTCGKPVIATRVGGLPEMIQHGVTGLLVAPRNEKQLADAITTLLEDRDRRVRMGKAGKDYIERACAPSVVARETVAVYRDVCGRWSKSQRGRKKNADKKIPTINSAGHTPQAG